MYISWTVFCLKEASEAMMENVQRIMESVEAVPAQEFRVDSYWKEPRMNRIGRGYRADRIPENLEQRIMDINPEGTLNRADQEHFIEYVLSETIPNILSSPTRGFVACSIYTNL